MVKWILLDEFHLSVRVTANLPKTSLIVRTLKRLIRLPKVCRFKPVLAASVDQDLECADADFFLENLPVYCLDLAFIKELGR